MPEKVLKRSGNQSILVSISIAVNKHCDNSNSSEELAYTSEVWSIIMVGSMTECTQAWYWKGAEGSASNSSGRKSKPLDLV